MIITLKPYPAYKDSGVPWLGKVPEHWEVLPGRALFREINDRGHPDEQLLSVTITSGVLRQTDLLVESFKKDSSNEDKSNYKLVQPGDLVYNKMRAWQGAVGVSAYRGIVSPAYIVQRLRTSENVPRYMHFLLRTSLFASEAERWSYGITSDQWSLRAEEFKCIYFSLPPLPEQTAIVRFLHYMDRRIRRVIRARQQQIKLLEEYKQALIHQAVTGQIDVRTGKPYPAYKDSGVKWLGQVPEHWGVKRNKFLLREVNERSADGSEELLTVSQYAGVRRRREQLTAEDDLLTNAASLVGYKRVMPGDLVVNIMLAWNGSLGVSSVAGIVSPSYCVFRTKTHEAHPRFCHYLFRTPLFTGAFKTVSTGVVDSRLRLYPDVFLRLPLVVPPRPEQTAIVEYLDAQTTKIDAAIAAARREIELLREYRERLIADVVTGKVDVREVAAQLPEEAELRSADEIERGEAEGEGPDDAAGEAACEEELET